MTEDTEQPEVAETPRRGRPPRDKEIATERRRRKVGAVHGLKLIVDEEKLDRNKFTYRFANDRPGRIHALTVQDDYEIVPQQDGAPSLSYHAGLGVDNAPMKTILVRKPKQWYEDDQREKQKQIDETDMAIKRGSLRNASTEAAAIAGAHGYVPEGSISIRDGRRK